MSSKVWDDLRFVHNIFLTLFFGECFFGEWSLSFFSMWNVDFSNISSSFTLKRINELEVFFFFEPNFCEFFRSSLSLDLLDDIPSYFKLQCQGFEFWI